MALVERRNEGGIAILEMNRPDRRNALSGELVEGLHAALGEAEADDAVRVIVLTGRGKAFCAGGDLAGGLTGDGVLDGERLRSRYGAVLAMLPRLSKPVIAALNGHALGGGLGLAMACDLVVVDAAARLGTPEVKVGLFPLVITAVLQRNVPRKALLEMMMLGSRVDAARALELGMVNRVAPEGESLAVALELAGQLAARSRAVLGLGKRSFHRVADLFYGDALAYLNGRLTVNLMLEDAGEGIGAFLQRRPPEWKDR